MKVEEITVPGIDGVPVKLFEKRLSTRERTVPEAAARLRLEGALLGALGEVAGAAGAFTPRLAGVGEDERGPWLRTERVPFPTLAQRLSESAEASAHELDRAWVERAVHAAFAALAELHDARDDRGALDIVHADVSPANVAVDDTATRVVFLDLELASWRESARRDGAFRGTIAYCAPEIARGEAPTVESDLFALAATFLHVALGVPPRQGPSLAALLRVAAEEPLLDGLRVDGGDLAARGLAHGAIVRCLAHVASERPTSAREVVQLLDAGRLC